MDQKIHNELSGLNFADWVRLEILLRWIKVGNFKTWTSLALCKKKKKKTFDDSRESTQSLGRAIFNFYNYYETLSFIFNKNTKIRKVKENELCDGPISGTHLGWAVAWILIFFKTQKMRSLINLHLYTTCFIDLFIIKIPIMSLQKFCISYINWYQI